MENKAIPANFWLRTAAFIIDNIINIVIGVIIMFIFPRNPETQIFSLANILASVLSIALMGLFLRYTQASPGKLLLGLKIINLKGDKLSWKQSILRPLLTTVFGYILFFGAQAVAFFRPDRRQLVDLILNTQVVQEDEHSSPIQPYPVIGIMFIIISVIFLLAYPAAWLLKDKLPLKNGISQVK